MAKHLVKCFYCGEIFDTLEEPYEKPRSNRFAHKKCFDDYQQNKSKEEQDYEDLLKYISELFNKDYNYPLTIKLITKYVTENGYSYSGIKKTLHYYYVIKGNPIAKAKGSIGIVPYIYGEASKYYYDIWIANQHNSEEKVAAIKKMKTTVIRIPPPEAKKKKRKLFSFLDEEDGD